MMPDSMAIAVLCSQLCLSEGLKPLTPKEWSRLAHIMATVGIQPADLLGYSAQDFRDKLQLDPAQTARMMRLLDRSASLSFELERYFSRGIALITRADEAYPSQLKKKLGHACPPLFYTAGALALLSQESVGYVGSRSISEDDVRFTKQTVAKTVQRGYLVVSGGSKGVDSIAINEALRQDGQAIVYLADSMERKMKDGQTIRAIQEGHLLLLSAAIPSAGFHTGMAMSRNKYIYAQSAGTVVVRASYNKGGTWSGATENLRHGWCPIFCWDKSDYDGNQALISQGAHPIDTTWDGDIKAFSSQTLEEKPPQQMSLFDM